MKIYKMKQLVVLLLMLGFIISCDSGENGKPLFDDFTAFDGDTWHYANWANGSIFNCIWNESQVKFNGDSKMRLILDKNPGEKLPYKSGELRTNKKYRYGLYEVRMKPAKNIGTVSSFFTYTGPSDEEPWDEIDIEFLGKDTTKVQFNYYTDGKGHHEYIHELGFDASLEMHTYAFKWEKDKITWYVDNARVHTARENLPSTAGRIMMNLWPGINVDEWLGKYDGITPLVAEYDWIKFTPCK